MSVDCIDPVKVNYDDFLSWESKHRVRSGLKKLRPYFDTPGIISFGGGYPHPSTWPVNAMTLSVPFVEESVFVPGYGAPTPNELLPLGEYTPPAKSEPLSPDLSTELQYGATYGAKQFLAWIKEHIRRVHSPPYDGWEVLSTAGNTDGIDGVLRVVFNRGDALLVEEFGTAEHKHSMNMQTPCTTRLTFPAYPGILGASATMGIAAIGVPTDQDGILASELDKIVSEWDKERRGACCPKAVVLVPTCSNPSGCTMPEGRRREVYAVARKHSLLIIEDDPYYFLQIRPDGLNSPLVPTFLSLDVDGRVLRLDSFSKIVAPGSRCGFVTGPSEIVTRMMWRTEASTNCPSGFSTAIISSVLRAWGGHEGFERKYIPHISKIYGERALQLAGLLRELVPEETLEVPEPSGGMFLYVRLKVENHPRNAYLAPEAVSDLVFRECVKEKVLVVPSVYFKAPNGPQWTKEEEAKRIFFRMSFAFPPPADIEKGAKRFARALRRQFDVA